MIFFGHLGLTAGAVKGAESLIHHKRQKADYRFVLAGSVLPDLVDKPIGWLFRDTFQNTRLFGHTLLFTAALALIGLLCRQFKKSSAVLLLAFGSFVHLLLDQMWLFPRILLWPFVSRSFPARPEGDWLAESLLKLLRDPVTLGGELAGLAVTIYLFLRALRRNRLREFFTKGEL